MRGCLFFVVILAATHQRASAALAQTLPARPAIFGDPILVTDPSHGELVLGRTTLIGAMRMFAVELADSVRLPLNRGANPDTVGPSSSSDSAAWPRLHHRLDLGAGRYTLYFDKNERLVKVAAERSRLPRAIRREDLVARYSTLRVHRRWSVQDELIAPLAPCISAMASVREGDDGIRDARHLKPGTVIEFGYRYTCRTRPSPISAGLNGQH
jgi:hypothetical protein